MLPLGPRNPTTMSAPLFYDSPTAVFYDSPPAFYDGTAAATESKKMKKIRRDIRNLSVPQKITRGGTVVTKMTGNPDFPTLATDVVDMANATTQMETDYNAAVTARQTAQALTMISDASAKAWDAQYNKVADLVDAKATTEPAKLGAGFELVSDKSPVGILPAPANLAVTMSEAPGSLTAQWDAMPKASGFLVEIAPSSNGPWTQVATPTASDCVITGLTSGTIYYVRVKAVSSAGVSAPSDIAMKMAP